MEHKPDCVWGNSDCEYKRTHHYCPHEEHKSLECRCFKEDKACRHPLATRPILYTDTVGGKQTMRDDLWAVTTEELNALLA